ncbi:MAG: hypothetical protein IKX99_02890 [Lachnospiraceae bacterium]|nr:hypothetical protein [Lachnospiraceae bacterium]MBO4462529.1 hypothetical protein [Lachnospiraceae bacterium]MBR5789035.1 hypothetical protein [Lachnospiraceae bacterium]
MDNRPSEFFEEFLDTLLEEKEFLIKDIKELKTEEIEKGKFIDVLKSSADASMDLLTPFDENKKNNEKILSLREEIYSIRDNIVIKNRELETLSTLICRFEEHIATVKKMEDFIVSRETL